MAPWSRSAAISRITNTLADMGRQLRADRGTDPGLLHALENNLYPVVSELDKIIQNVMIAKGGYAAQPRVRNALEASLGPLTTLRTKVEILINNGLGAHSHRDLSLLALEASQITFVAASVVREAHADIDDKL